MAEKFKGTYGKDSLITPPGRLSYPFLTKKNDGGDYPSNKYETVFLVPKSVDIKYLQEAALKIAQQQWPGKVKSLSDIEHPFRDGDEKEDENLKGCWYLKPKSKRRPGIVDRNKQPVEDEEEVYGGRNARLSMIPFTYMQAGKKGVSFQLRNVQLLEGGERFGGSGPSAEEDFGGDAPDEGGSFDDGEV